MDSSGFTVLEILVALAMGVVFIAAITALIIDQTQTHEDHQMKVMMQQNGRAALSVMANELMIAGYSPDPAEKSSITKAAMDGVTFEYIDDAGNRKSVGYSFIASEDRIGVSRDGGDRQTLLRDVEMFKILYAYDADDLGAGNSRYGVLEQDPSGTATAWAYSAAGDGPLDRCHTLDASGQIATDNEAAQTITINPPSLDRIRAAKIWLLMRSTKKKNKNTAQAPLENIPGFDRAQRLDTEHYAYRLYTTTVKLRNMYY